MSADSCCGSKTKKELWPAYIIRVSSDLVETGKEWSLVSKNTEEILGSKASRGEIELFAAKNGYKVVLVVNDYN